MIATDDVTSTRKRQLVKIGVDGKVIRVCLARGGLRKDKLVIWPGSANAVPVAVGRPLTVVIIAS